MTALFLAAASLSGVASATGSTDERADFAAALVEAEALRARAAAAGFEWLNTAALLRQAREQADAGEPGQARALLEQGRKQAEMALEQAEREAEAWTRRVVR